jgi:hypothetical protein
MKTTHKIGQKLWRMLTSSLPCNDRSRELITPLHYEKDKLNKHITSSGKPVMFNNQCFQVEKRLFLEQTSFHWLHISSIHADKVATISHGSRDIKELNFVFQCEFYKAKGVGIPDI